MAIIQPTKACSCTYLVFINQHKNQQEVQAKQARYSAANPARACPQTDHHQIKRIKNARYEQQTANHCSTRTQQKQHLLAGL